MNRHLKRDKIDRFLNLAIKNSGMDKVMCALEELAGTGDQNINTLTIIANAGVHNLPEKYKRGDVFIASIGNLDLSSRESIHNEFTTILTELARKLKSKQWGRVFIVPFGPTVLSMNIKLLVYRVCGFESIDVMNISGEDRVDVSIELRKLIINSDINDLA